MKRVILDGWSLRLGPGLSLEPGATPGEYLLVSNTPAEASQRMRHRIRGLVRSEKGGGLVMRMEEGITCRAAPGGRDLTFLVDLPPFVQT